MKKELIIEVCTALLLSLFTYTSLSKFLDYDRFVFQMSLAPVPLMKTIAPAVGIILPSAELLLSAGLLLKRYQLKAFYFSLLLLIVFEVYIVVMLFSGLRLPCTCGGVISKMSWTQHLLFNFFFIIVATIAIIFNKKVNLPRAGHDQHISRA